MNITVMKSAFQRVFRNTRYIAAAVLIPFFMFFIFILANNFSTFVTVLGLHSSVKLMIDIVTNGAANLLDESAALFASIVAVCVLSGITMSMIIYQLRVTRSVYSKKNLAGFGGIFGGALSSTCSACSTTLVSIFGVAGGLAILPLKGLEISLPSIGILIASMYYISKGLIEPGKCKV